MDSLKQKILNEGEVYEGNILKVDGFLNHRIDIPFMREIAKEFHRLFKDDGVNKILTIEASGIAIGALVAEEFGCRCDYFECCLCGCDQRSKGV